MQGQHKPASGPGVGGVRGWGEATSISLATRRTAPPGRRPGGWTWAEHALKVTGRARRVIILHWFEIILQGFKTYRSPLRSPFPEFRLKSVRLLQSCGQVTDGAACQQPVACQDRRVL